MPLVDLLSTEHVYVDPPWATFEDAVTGMVAGVARAGSIDPTTCGAATEALLLRERASSTAIPEIGLAIPHARLAGLQAPVAALAVAARGLYDAAPSLPIRIVVLVLSPPQATDAHLQLLAGVATDLRSPSLRASLLRAADAAQVLAALVAHG
jgi:mannitol/fructose-specific phosphotransferase system IIA component (Ntr-type)